MQYRADKKGSENRKTIEESVDPTATQWGTTVMSLSYLHVP